MNFSPVIDVNTNSENPIIGNRSFGENKVNVSQKGIAMINGLSKAGVLSSAKHFPGHGDTSQDSHKVLPKIIFSRNRIDSIELFPFKKLINKGLSSVMIAHLNIPSLDENVPSSMSKTIITKILKEELGFKGLIFTDALDMKGATSFSKLGNIDLVAFLAGNDVLLMSNDISKGIRAIKNAYNSNIITENRLSHSVKKILKAKYKVGLNNFKKISQENLIKDLNSVSDKKLYSKAISSAITVIKNKNDIIPLIPNKRYGLITLGDSSSEIFSEYLSKKINIIKINPKNNFKSILNEIKDTDALIISFHRSDKSPFNAFKFSVEEITLIEKIAKTHPVILNVFVTPYALNSFNNINLIEGVVVSYQNSNLAQIESASIILGEKSSIGSLPVSIKDSFLVGYGIKTRSNNILEYSDPISVGVSSDKLNEIDKLINISIDSMMTPGAQVLVAKKGKIFYHKTFGYQTYKKKHPVKKDNLYDIASLTKILATLPLIIQEVDKGDLKLDDTLGDLFPRFSKSNKGNIKVIDVLTHYAKLKPWIPFYLETQKKGNKLKKNIYKKKYNVRFSKKVAENIYIKNNQSESIIQQIFKSELRDTLEYKYSDFPFIIFQHYFEEKYGKPLDEIADQKIFKPLGLIKTTFNPLKNSNQKLIDIIPSEIDTYYRNQELRGYVHDMAAGMLGGVAGHAGMFSTAREIAIIMQMYLNKGYYGGERFFSSKVFDEFNNCVYCHFNNRRGVGFDKPQIEGEGSTCECVPKSSFGHSGFTGTYTWADPEHEIVYVFLSNRTYPTMKNTLLIDHSIRTRIQKIIYDSISD